MVTYKVPKGNTSKTNVPFIPTVEQYPQDKPIKNVTGYAYAGGGTGLSDATAYTVPSGKVFFLETCSLTWANRSKTDGVGGDAYLIVDNFGRLLVGVSNYANANKTQNGFMALPFPRALRFEAGTRFRVHTGNNADPDGEAVSGTFSGFEVDK